MEDSKENIHEHAIVDIGAESVNAGVQCRVKQSGKGRLLPAPNTTHHLFPFVTTPPPPPWLGLDVCPMNLV